MKHSEETHRLIATALRLEYVLIAYNVLEAIASVWIGWRAGSIALVGFGFDSVIEVVAAGTLVWRLKKHSHDEEKESEIDKKALRIVGVTFFLLAAYILYESIKTLVLKEMPDETYFGILIAALSLVIMPYLGLAKRKIARKIKSASLEADAMETLICATLSAILLIGLGLNAWLGWWWADPVAGLVMVLFIAKEGWEACEKSASRENH